MSGTSGNSPDPIGLIKRQHSVHVEAVCGIVPAMIAKLDKNAHKGHWSAQSSRELLDRLHEELVELRDAEIGGDPSRICDEAVDVANFAMFIFDLHKNKRADGLQGHPELPAL